MDEKVLSALFNPGGLSAQQRISMDLGCPVSQTCGLYARREFDHSVVNDYCVLL